MISTNFAFILAGVLLLSGVLASKVAAQFGIPALFLFLIIGMLAGSEGIGGIHFDNPDLTRTLGDVALAIILFAGGLDTTWKTIRPVLGAGLTLATVGVFSTMLLLGTFAWFVLGSFSSFNLGPAGITWVEGLLLGAIMSSTDAAAVFSILKSSQLDLKGQLQPLLELESGSNDPIAVLLTSSLVQILTVANFSVLDLVGSLVQQLIVGSLMGYGSGLVMVWAVKRLRLTVSGLYPIATLAILLLSFGLTNTLQGNGFLAVYIAGIVLGSHQVPHQETIISFHDGLNWLMSISMFLVLGLLVFPSQLPEIAAIGFAIALFLIFVARPLSVFLCLTLTKLTVKEKSFLAWVGLRGAVPIILATLPLTAGITGADQIFNVVFFTVLVSMLLQGLSLPWVAHRLNLVANGSAD
ncbi:MAG: potassium/proton antiporter [Cyanobacteria bacterium P01_H01_bin.121]